MLTTHFDLVSSPLWVPGWLKKGYLALIPKIPRPNFVRDNFFSEHRLVGCPEHRSGIPCSSSTVVAHLEPPSSRKRSKTGKKGLFWPQNTLLGNPEVLRGPRGARFGPNCHCLVKPMITTQFGLVSGPFWPKMPLFGASEVSQVTRFGCFIVLHGIACY